MQDDTMVNNNENFITEEAMKDFVDFLSDDKTYIDPEVGTCHTDNHSNW